MKISLKIKCSIVRCHFPNTCKWNKVCMQKKLDESLTAKDLTVKKIDRNKKERFS